MQIGEENMSLINKEKRIFKKITKEFNKISKSIDSNPEQRNETYFVLKKKNIMTKKDFLELGLNKREDLRGFFLNNNTLPEEVDQNQLIDYLGKLYDRFHDQEIDQDGSVSPYVYEM